MSQNLAIQELLKKHTQLVSERDAMYAKFSADINEIESAVQILSGKTVWDFGTKELYDDERHDYIKSSQEEI